MQSIPPTTADKQTQAQKRRGSRSRKLLGAKAKSYRLKNYIRPATPCLSDTHIQTLPKYLDIGLWPEVEFLMICMPIIIIIICL